jgi:F0F1-type ATP synthase membrane subunit c/vacuolar-type H+-ATPase subunit K
MTENNNNNSDNNNNNNTGKILTGLGIGFGSLIGGVLSALAVCSLLDADSRSDAMDASLFENNGNLF